MKLTKEDFLDSCWSIDSSDWVSLLIIWKPVQKTLSVLVLKHINSLLFQQYFRILYNMFNESEYITHLLFFFLKEQPFHNFSLSLYLLRLLSLLHKDNPETVIKTMSLTLGWVYVFKDSFQQMSQPYVKSNLTSIVKHWIILYISVMITNDRLSHVLLICTTSHQSC